MTITEYLPRFLRNLGDAEPYWVDFDPTEDTIRQASAAAKDDVGFEAHKAAFEALTEVLDFCAAEEITCRGSGAAARNASKHPRVVALKELAPEERAALAVASAQTLAWMEQCRKWVPDASLRNQINKRVMTAIMVAGIMKKGYSPTQLSALARIGSNLRDNDVFVLRVRGAIAEILAGSAQAIPTDEPTQSAARRLAESVLERPNAAPATRAATKLKEA